ncbi:hypothetical protein [Nocardia sp. NPDC004750]
MNRTEGTQGNLSKAPAFGDCDEMRKVAISLFRAADSFIVAGLACDSSYAGILKAADDLTAKIDNSSDNVPDACCRAHLFIRAATEIFEAAAIMEGAD